MNSEDGKSPVHSDWISAQRLGCIAWALAQAELFDRADWIARRKFLAEEFSAQVDSLSLRRQLRKVGELPISVLEVCTSNVVQSQLPNEKKILSKMAVHLEHIKATGVLLRTDQSGASTELKRASLAEGADIIAQMLLFSDLPAVSIAAALSFFLDDAFQRLQSNQADLDQLQSYVDSVRALKHNSLSSLKAQSDLTRFLLNFSSQAILIENSVLDALLFWPLLVFKSPGAHSFGGYSFPILIDVVMDGQCEVRVVRATGLSGSQLSDFKTSTGEAFGVAKDLWRSKNGHARHRWADIRNASCVIDFGLAGRICKGTGVDPVWQERSAEAYFAQAFLTRLIGRYGSSNVAVSGSIGVQQKQMVRESFFPSLPADFLITRDDPATARRFIEARTALTESGRLKAKATDLLGSDRWIMPVDNTIAKFRFASISGKYNKIVLHPDNRIPEAVVKESEYLETNYVKSNGAAADVSQLGGWRPYKYVRCPDLGHLLHKDSLLLPQYGSMEVLRTQQTLQQEGRVIVELDSGHSAISVASIVNYLNFQFRFSLDRIPPQLGWSFVRVENGETNSRFWHVFLKAIGASDLAIKEHFLRTSNEFTAGLIASLMNGDAIAEKLGCQDAPDLIVVFAAKNAVKAGTTLAEKQIIPLDFDAVLSELRAMDVKSLRQPYSAVLGHARIIIVPEDLEYKNSSYFSAVGGIDKGRDNIFRDLTIFDRGFTVQMAFHAAREHFYSMPQAKGALERYVREGTLWKAGDLYFIPHAMRGGPVEASIESVLKLKRAGNSLMPGIGYVTASGFSTSECFDVERTRDAQVYLDRALVIARHVISATEDEGEKGRINSIIREISCEQDLLSRFFDMPSWGVVHRLTSSSSVFSRREVYDYAADLLFRMEEADCDILPSAYTLLASAAKGAMLECWKNDDASGVELFKKRVDALFDAAEGRAEAFSTPMDVNQWLIHALSWRSGYLQEYKSLGKGRVARIGGHYHGDTLSQNDRRLLSLVVAGDALGINPNAVSLMRIGDKQSRPDIAMKVYLSVVLSSPKFFTAYPRLFGLMLVDDEEAAFLEVASGKQFWLESVKNALSDCERNIAWLSVERCGKVAAARIEVGLDRMRQFVGGADKWS